MCYSIVHRYPKHSNHESERFHLPCRDMLAYKLSTGGLNTLPRSCPSDFVSHMQTFINAAEAVEKDLVAMGNEWDAARETLVELDAKSLTVTKRGTSHELKTPCFSPVFFSPGLSDNQSALSVSAQSAGDKVILSHERIRSVEDEQATARLYQRLEQISGNGLALKRVNKHEVPAPILVCEPLGASTSGRHPNSLDTPQSCSGTGGPATEHGQPVAPHRAVFVAPKTSDS